MKINYTQLSLKAHYLFFYAAIGSIWPYIFVYGKQLEISPLIMGNIAAILPIMHFIAKLIFGYVMDYYRTWRKAIFIAMIMIPSACLISMYFLPPLPGPMLPDHQFQNVSCKFLLPCDKDNHASEVASCNGTKDTTCHWICKDTNFSMRVSFHAVEKKAIISSDTTCLLNDNETSLCQGNVTTNYNCNVTCNNFENNYCLYTSITFWGFVILISFGIIGVNVSVCLTDAICFDILGEDGRMGYGRYRLWGAVGYSLTALLSGYTVDLWSQGRVYKTYTPAFLILLVFICIDLICCRKLELPLVSSPTSILKDVFAILKLIPNIIFFCFAILAGTSEGFMNGFLFWYAEDLAMATGYMGEIKLIQGLMLSAGFFGSKLLFYFMSGKILKKFGYGYTFTFCFVCYAFRLGLPSLAPTPWYIVMTEFILEGPTYALSYTTVVTYASAISSPNISATVQGIAAGVKEGLGYAIGAFMGGILYNKVGGKMTLRIFSALAALSAVMFLIIYTLYLKHKTPDTRNHVEWRKPDDAQKQCVVAET